MYRKQYKITENQIELYVKKVPYIGRVFLLFLAFVMVALPLLGIVFNFIDGNTFHFGYLIGLGIFTLLAFYFLRLYLWNTYGKEIIILNKNTLDYYVDYKYFKGNQQSIKIDELSFSYDKIGFEEEYLGLFTIISNNNEFIQSAIKMPLMELIELRDLLTKKINS